MKAFFRHPAVQRTLSLCLSSYLKLVYATLRWTRQGQEHVETVWARQGETGAVMAFWHAGIPLAPCAPRTSLRCLSAAAGGRCAK